MKFLFYRAVDILLAVIEFVIFARVIVSWLPIPRDNQLIRLLYQLTEPILGPIRSLVQKSAIGGNTMLDFSPIIAWLIIRVIRMIIFSF